MPIGHFVWPQITNSNPYLVIRWPEMHFIASVTTHQVYLIKCDNLKMGQARMLGKELFINISSTF